MEATGYTLNDIATVTNGGNWGGNNAFLYIILFAMIFGGNGFGRNGDYGQFATAASQQEILFGQRFSNLDNKMDRLGNGIADSTYALNNAITSEGRGIQTAISQMRTEMISLNAQTNSNIDAKFAALEKAQLEQTISAQAARINALEMQAQMCGVVRYPNSMSYNAGSSPFCNCNNGCGCGNV